MKHTDLLVAGVPRGATTAVAGDLGLQHEVFHEQGFASGLVMPIEGEIPNIWIDEQGNVFDCKKSFALIRNPLDTMQSLFENPNAWVSWFATHYEIERWTDYSMAAVFYCLQTGMAMRHQNSGYVIANRPSGKDRF